MTRRRRDLPVEIRGSGARLRRAAACVLAMGLLGSCAIPGELYEVAPSISGTIRGIPPDRDEIELQLRVMHRESPSLYEVQLVPLLREADQFSFDRVELRIAGHEFSKFYRVYLHYRDGARDFVIWRGEFNRYKLAGKIELDCDLTRPPRLGQPCQVRDPLEQVWLVESGERTFARLCARCHGAGGKGLVDGTGEIVALAPDLTRIAARRPDGFDWSEVAEWIEGSAIPREHGSREMPIWGERLSAEYRRYENADELVGATLDPVIVYLRSIQR